MKTEKLNFTSQIMPVIHSNVLNRRKITKNSLKTFYLKHQHNIRTTKKRIRNQSFKKPSHVRTFTTFKNFTPDWSNIIKHFMPDFASYFVRSKLIISITTIRRYLKIIRNKW